MADVELLPLPAIERWEVTGDYAFPTATDPEGHAVDYDAHVDAMQSYASACVEANLAPLQAENERLRVEVEAGDTNLAAAMSAVAELEARAERLAEALRKLSADLRTLASGETPDGDGVPVNVILGAEKRLAAIAAANGGGNASA